MINDFQVPVFGTLSGFLKFFAWLAMVIFNLCFFRENEEQLSFVSRMVLKAKPWKRYRLVKNLCVILEIMALASLYFFPTTIGISLPLARVANLGNINYFATPIFAPFIVMIPVALLSISPLKHLDLYAQAYPAALVFLKIACFVQGCCNGMEMDSGMYNYDTGLIEFPIQLLEAGIAILMMFALVVYRKKTKHVGTVMPLYMIIYSVQRFIIQFFRADYPDVIIGLDGYQLFSIGTIILGIIEWILVVKLAPKSKFLMEGIKYKPIEDFCNGIPFPKKEKKVTDGNNE